MAAGFGVAFVLLGRRTLDGKPGVQGEATSRVSVFHGGERSNAIVFHLYPTNTTE